MASRYQKQTLRCNEVEMVTTVSTSSHVKRLTDMWKKSS